MSDETRWRSRLLAAMPDDPISRRIRSYAALERALDVAAHNRRMPREEYSMRAIESFVAYDTGLPRRDLAATEPYMTGVGYMAPALRLRGQGHGLWTIAELIE